MRLPVWLRENFRLKVFALILTSLVYAIVIAGRTYERDYSFSVAIDGLPDDQVIVGVPPEVRVRLSATPGGFSALGDASRRVIHLPMPGAGKGQVHLTDADLRLPRGVKALAITPEQFSLRPEKLVTRPLPVRAESRGTPANGQKVLSLRPIPEKIQVTAPQSAFAILSTLTTEPVNVEGRAEDFSVRVRIEADIPFLSLASEGVDVAVDLGSEVGSRSLPKVALQVVGPRPERGTLDRRSVQVRVRGPRAVLDKMETSDLLATVDLLALPSQVAGTYAVTPQISNLPQELEIVSVWPKTLKLTLR